MRAGNEWVLSGIMWVWGVDKRAAVCEGKYKYFIIMVKIECVSE